MRRGEINSIRRFDRGQASRVAECVSEIPSAPLKQATLAALSLVVVKTAGGGKVRESKYGESACIQLGAVQQIRGFLFDKTDVIIGRDTCTNSPHSSANFSIKQPSICIQLHSMVTTTLVVATVLLFCTASKLPECR